jgi:hypothetical protein
VGHAWYCLPLLAYPLSFLALQWIVSVQNMEIIKAMRRDPNPVVVAKTFYARRTLERDYGCHDVVSVSTEADLPATVVARRGYGPYFSYYTYFPPEPLENFPELSHTTSGNDQSVIASRNRRNIVFFLRSFFPQQVVRLPSYLLDVVVLRCRQLGRVWLASDDAVGGRG